MLKQKSSAKEGKRYLLLNGKKKDIEKAILDYIGILGYARASPFFVIPKKSNKKLGKTDVILAVNRKEIENVKAALGLSSEKIEVLRVSGTLNGLTK